MSADADFWQAGTNRRREPGANLHAEAKLHKLNRMPAECCGNPAALHRRLARCRIQPPLRMKSVGPTMPFFPVSIISKIFCW